MVMEYFITRIQKKKINTKFDFSNFDDSEDIWIYYEGEFIDDDKSGHGTLYLSNG